MAEPTHPDTQPKTEGLAERPSEATDMNEKKVAEEIAHWTQRFRAALLAKYDEQVGDAGRVKEMAAVRDAILGDVAQIGKLWRGVLDKMETWKFSFGTGRGIFLHDKEAFEQTLQESMSRLKTKIEEDCERYGANIAAGKGAVDQLKAQYYTIGEPLQKNETQVSALTDLTLTKLLTTMTL